MKRYTALLFDLCDTVMPFRTDQMPAALIRGKEIRTTTPLLYASFQEHYSHIPYERFHDDFVEATEAIALLREAEGVELTSADRFELFLDRLGLLRGEQWEALHQRFLKSHLGRIESCLTLSPAYRTLLADLKQKYKMGMVSNFDDTATVHRVLEREGARDLFEVVVISAEIGLRKPRPELFLDALKKLEVSPADALFIGDSWENDVGGAKGVGIDAVWLNPSGHSPPDRGARPDYIFSDLTELLQIL